MLNRTAIILRYQEPFVRWINEADVEASLKRSESELTAAGVSTLLATLLWGH